MKVLIHKGKHYDRVFDASTPEAHNRALAQLMIDQASDVYPPDKPTKPTSMTVEVPIDASPGQAGAIFAKATQEKNRYKAAVRAYENEKEAYEEFKVLAEQGVNALAARARYFWGIFFDGGDYNYYEIEEVEQP